jgi:hypothetical protein
MIRSGMESGSTDHRQGHERLTALRGRFAPGPRRRATGPLYRWSARTLLLAVIVLLQAGRASADDIVVMTSGAFTAAYLELSEQFGMADPANQPRAAVASVVRSTRHVRTPLATNSPSQA